MNYRNFPERTGFAFADLLGLLLVTVILVRYDYQADLSSDSLLAVVQLGLLCCFAEYVSFEFLP